MAVKHFCDRCGVEGADRFTLNMATSGEGWHGMLPTADKDLCHGCARELIAAVNAAIDHYLAAQQEK